MAAILISRSDMGYLSRDLFHRLLLTFSLESSPPISFYLLQPSALSSTARTAPKPSPVAATANYHTTALQGPTSAQVPHSRTAQTRASKKKQQQNLAALLSARSCSVSAAPLAMSASAPASAQQDYRLPTDVKPTHYDLTVWTDLENSKFEGIVHIDVTVNKETSAVVLNTANLELGEASLKTGGALDTVLDVSKRELDTENERVVYSLAKPLSKGASARLSVAFKGELTGDMLGYYRSTGGKDGELRYTLTQFEPTAARRAFPCWDEPLLKATFAVTLVSRVNSVNLSNMPAISEVYKPDAAIAEPWIAKKLSTLPDAGQWKITQFEATPPVSTYLVAYANGPFEYLESSYKSPLSGKVRPLRIYATADVIGQAQFALDIKRLVLPLYEEVFDIEYPLPKLDTLVASDFDSGAMENWGLITGRTQAFLLDPASSSIKYKQNVAATQSHEVAHMWFGNITTMEWWDNLYLNEGFATLMGEKIILDK
ncbi:hypothetical protein VTO73DRAFT_14408 [Trametes versicolor]